MTKTRNPLLIALIAVAALGLVAAAQTADEILDMMDAEADTLAEGSMLSTVAMHNDNADGTTTEYSFASLGKPDYSLLYYLEPADVAGTIFLMHDAKTDDEDNRLWLYLPFLGIPKELVSDDERGGSFAGSSLSYDDLGDQDRRQDHDAVLLGEEDLTISEMTRTVYKLESTAKPDADVDDLRTVLWVDKEFLIMLKLERYNDLGNLSSTMDILELVEFEGKLTASIMLAADVSAGSSTTITISGQRRPEAEIPDEIFAPESLTTFNLADWGF